MSDPYVSLGIYVTKHFSNNPTVHSEENSGFVFYG